MRRTIRIDCGAHHDEEPYVTLLIGADEARRVYGGENVMQLCEVFGEACAAVVEDGAHFASVMETGRFGLPIGQIPADWLDNLQEFTAVAIERVQWKFPDRSRQECFSIIRKWAQEFHHLYFTLLRETDRQQPYYDAVDEFVEEKLKKP